MPGWEARLILAVAILPDFIILVMIYRTLGLGMWLLDPFGVCAGCLLWQRLQSGAGLTCFCAEAHFQAS